MSRVYVFLADGFEEIEGLTVVDLLRRAKVETEMISIMDTKQVKGSHGIEVSADSMFADQTYEDAELLVLPGGMPGTLNLGNHEGLCTLLKKHYEEGKKIAAICAAPSVFGQLGFLNGRVLLDIALKKYVTICVFNSQGFVFFSIIVVFVSTPR